MAHCSNPDPMTTKTTAPKFGAPEVTPCTKKTPPPALPTTEGTGGVVLCRPANDSNGGNGAGANGAAMPKAQLSSLIKSAPDILREDAGLSRDLNRRPQDSWALFLNSFDDV